MLFILSRICKIPTEQIQSIYYILFCTVFILNHMLTLNKHEEESLMHKISGKSCLIISRFTLFTFNFAVTKRFKSKSNNRLLFKVFEAWYLPQSLWMFKLNSFWDSSYTFWQCLNYCVSVSSCLLMSCFSLLFTVLSACYITVFEQLCGTDRGLTAVAEIRGIFPFSSAETGSEPTPVWKERYAILKWTPLINATWNEIKLDGVVLIFRPPIHFYDFLRTCALIAWCQ